MQGTVFTRWFIFSMLILASSGLVALKAQNIEAQEGSDSDEIVELAIEVPLEVQKAIEITKPVPRNAWAFTRTEVDDQTTWVERFDPRAENSWVLLSINGQEPNDVQKGERAKIFKQRESEDAYVGENDFAGLAQAGSWKLLEETAQVSIYGFKPQPEDRENEKFMRFVEGKLSIDKASGAVQGFELFNTQAFKPVAIAKVNTFKMQLSMQEVAPGVYLANKISTNVNGKAMFKRFEQKNIVELSEFEKAL